MVAKIKSIVVFGATSALAQEVIRKHALLGDKLTLVARNKEHNAIVAADAVSKGSSSVRNIELDLAQLDQHDELVEALHSDQELHDIYYFFQGVLPDQQRCEDDWSAAEASINLNFLSVASLLSRLANKLEPAERGALVVVTSVAGDRGRQSNYTYGAAKGALSLYLQGLRNRLHAKGVVVLDVKPGFMDTPMTSEIDKSGPLWVCPERVATDIIRAVENKRSVIYSPWFWWPIMKVIRSIPEFLFKRLNL